MIPMPQLPAPDDELTQLTQLAKRFAHWRHNRPSPKARIPQELWDDAVSLTLNSHLSASRVAKHLGLCTADRNWCTNRRVGLIPVEPIVKLG